MKYSLVFLSLFLVMGVGCTSTPSTLTSDFTPVRGSASAPSADITDSPHDRRIMTAISYDGLSYIQNDAWVCDQCHAPDAIIKDGTIYLYYTGGIIGDRAYTTAVAISSDQGKTWTYKYVDIVGDEGGAGRFFDPDVVLLEDGTFRMYFVSGLPRSLFYAESSDGITYDYKARLFSPSEDEITHPTVINIGDAWYLYALSEDNAHRVWFLTSTNGTNFEMYSMTSFPMEGVPATPSNALWVDDRFISSSLITTKRSKASGARTGWTGIRMQAHASHRSTKKRL
jgi:hypothetical protein